MNTNYTFFSNKLNELLFVKGISKKEFAKAVDCSQNTISRYSRGLSMPSRNKLRQISDYLGVEPEYFLSNSYETDSKMDLSFKDVRNIEFSKKLYELLRQHNLSQADLANKIGVTRQAINCYINGRDFPRFNVLEKICQLFNVDKSYFSEQPSKEDVLFLVEKIPTSFSTCPFSKLIIGAKSTDIRQSCIFGGECEIGNNACTHLKEIGEIAND